MTPTRFILALLPSAVVAFGNYAVLARLVDPAACPSCTAWLVGGPLLLGVMLAILLPAPTGVLVEGPSPAPPCPPPDESALRLLGVLQEEGRLVDFLEEDLTSYPDEQIGAAVRGIHEGCRKALRERVAIEPVLRGAEGETVTVDAGFDPAAIRLTGNVTGAPPFRGVLRHAGWRATRAAVPERRGHDPHVLAPAEVEIA
jgi:hypothetical protein